ncbi:MAG: hypothetical protein U9Q82_09090 [Chloroflexota bacterium]|nr:hypothetical protein [Chloroflexota bacterium]
MPRSWLGDAERLDKRSNAERWNERGGALERVERRALERGE